MSREEFPIKSRLRILQKTVSWSGCACPCIRFQRSIVQLQRPQLQQLSSDPEKLLATLSCLKNVVEFAPQLRNEINIYL